MTTEELLNNVREKLGHETALFKYFKRALLMVLSVLAKGHIRPETALEDLISEEWQAQLFYNYCLETLFQIATICHGGNEKAFPEANAIADIIYTILGEQNILFGVEKKTITFANCSIFPRNDIVYAVRQSI